MTKIASNMVEVTHKELRKALDNDPRGEDSMLKRRIRFGICLYELQGYASKGDDCNDFIFDRFEEANGFIEASKTMDDGIRKYDDMFNPNPTYFIEKDTVLKMIKEAGL